MRVQVHYPRGALDGANQQGCLVSRCRAFSNLVDVISEFVGHFVGPLELA
jgi:hypothetical protein